MKLHKYQIEKECERQGIHSKNYHCIDKSNQSKRYILKNNA